MTSSTVVAAAGTAVVPSLKAAAAQRPESEGPFRYCLNTSTIRGQKLPLDQVVEIAASAGYNGIEPWVREIEDFQRAGGSVADLRKQIEDRGLVVESAIAFANWIVDDDEKRKQALEQAKREMDLVAMLGGMRIAAPPAGATNQGGMDLFAVAERYRALLDVGREAGVIPQLEVWGFSKTCSRLGESVLVAVESGHPDACLLLDVYHIYKGGSDFTGIKLLGSAAMHVFHMNDYPADPPRESIGDADRIYPGDGVAPLDEILSSLQRLGFHGALSLELFNPNYWKQDPLNVARTGLLKMRESVERSLG